MEIPSLILKQLYTFGSLDNVDGGVRFSLKNRLSDATLSGLTSVKINNEEIPLEQVTLALDDGSTFAPAEVTTDNPIPFPLRTVVHLAARGRTLSSGKHAIALGFVVEPFGVLELKVEDSVSDRKDERIVVPKDKVNDYTREAAAARARFIEEHTGQKLEHVSAFSFDPSETQGNVENFTGVAQIPIGFAGPLQVNGEHASGEYLIPLATTEGTLVASYNRGIKVINLSGGVTCTVQDDRMQRAPVFVFDSAREALAFKLWVAENMEGIRDAAEATSSVAKLLEVDTYLTSKFAYLRFNFATGDAAGQNMVGRATFAASSWILDRVDTVRRFYLESNLATDKKASHVNIMRTRGKRVTAEAVVKREHLVEVMRVEPESLFYHSSVGNVGAFLSGANNNGCHSPNAITAMFIATGQDVANVAESSAGILYTEITERRDFYISLTIPSLIVATYGGGTGLPTQRECLGVLDCVGRDKAKKLAEIIAGVALAGELSLGAAISSLDWVSSHERYGRNR